MTSLVAEINATIAAFQKDAELNVNKGNKAAGTRARKASLKLEKLMKTYRKNSVK
ncbi:MAG: histone H1 [Muribaculum sp.]|nr:histone H1 [Muribaculum sp.]